MAWKQHWYARQERADLAGDINEAMARITSDDTYVLLNWDRMTVHDLIILAMAFADAEKAIARAAGNKQ